MDIHVGAGISDAATEDFTEINEECGTYASYLLPATGFFEFQVINSLSDVIQDAVAVSIFIEKLVRCYRTIDNMRPAKVQTGSSDEVVDRRLTG